MRSVSVPLCFLYCNVQSFKECALGLRYYNPKPGRWYDVINALLPKSYQGIRSSCKVIGSLTFVMLRLTRQPMTTFTFYHYYWQQFWIKWISKCYRHTMSCLWRFLSIDWLIQVNQRQNSWIRAAVYHSSTGQVVAREVCVTFVVIMWVLSLRAQNISRWANQQLSRKRK